MFRQAVPLAAFSSRGGGPAPTKGTLGGGGDRRGAGPQVSAGANWEFRQRCCHQSLLKKMSVMVQSANKEDARGGGVGWGGLRLQGGCREGSAVGRQHQAWLCCEELWASCGDAFACEERQDLALGPARPLVGSGSTEPTHGVGGKRGTLRGSTALPEVVAGPDTSCRSKRAAQRSDG